ncbi:MAG TPA: CDP-glycerol glycerophosphotransferase family protein [Bacillales bacterium]|nr:CDP-glycerol glycerophosphotransferase family protein [Bacillales bacterium]
MVKETIITLYLQVCKVMFAFFKTFRLKRKVTFLTSFGQNSIYVLEEMKRRGVACEVVFLYEKTCPYVLDSVEGVRALRLDSGNPIDWLRSIYHMATSKTIILDNYFAILSAFEFREGVECIQLWHAAGAIKKFGLKDRSVPKRRKQAIRRFRKVYERFHKVAVGSEAMAEIFTEAFDLPPENMIRTGVPRTDLFFDSEKIERITEQLRNANPALQDKKVILYAPTFRDGQRDGFECRLDFDSMERALKDTHVLLLRFHPTVTRRNDYERTHPGFVFDYSDHPDVNELLLITDVLVTDYSSIPYEFSLLRRPMIFFTKDQQEYKRQRGYFGDYESIVPGPVTNDTKSVIELLLKGEFDMGRIERFSQLWNRYSTGQSSKNVVDYLVEGGKQAEWSARERKEPVF